jgi:pantothenate kinase type III
MALKGGSKYVGTAVPVTGSPVTAVAATSVPQPTCSQAGNLMAATARLTLTLAGAANTDTYRCFILPAGHIVVDIYTDMLTAATGAVTFGVLGQACAAVDGGTALTLDAIAANSSFTQAINIATASTVRRILSIPAVTTNAVTKNASVGIAVPYDRVIGLNCSTVVGANDCVLDATLIYTAA